ncbi:MULTISPECIES: ABC transporter ATP-binding protein [Carnobacterium]|uniref:ABC transporter ATP-binding protein n=1 Tax=Carnobacterium TaxID=2747 RepID=UPI002040181C|nr:ABC transporter ATP-binding protein [Carnobacterium inhibens]MCM3512487.1 ABC transporter ATP-binding protein [Carnobacterium inhibens]
MEFNVEINHLNKTIGKKKIIKDLSLNIKKGEVFGLLGPNGAGKTTTIRMIVGLIEITAGSVKICGHDVKTNHKEALENVGAIVENPEMYPFLSGLENLKYFSRMHKDISTEKIEEIVKFVNLEGRIKDKVKTYSLGMRQRLGIAQSLLNNPKVLILDEPTNGLDPAGIKELRQYIQTLAHEKGVTVIVSSHLLSEIELMCDRVAIIKEGELIAIENLKEKTSHRNYQLKVSPNDKARELLVKEYQVHSQVTNGLLEFQLSAPNLEMPDIVKLFVGNNIAIYSIEPKENSLEDKFMNLTMK